MAGSFNSALIVGRVGRDPESRTFSNGGKVVNLTVATSEQWTKDGERQEKTTWHRVTVLNEKTGEFVERFVKKGSLVCVQGKIDNRKFTNKEGQEQTVTEIVVDRFRGDLTLLDSKGSGDGERPSSKPAARGGSTGGGGWAKDDDLNDSIPFGPEWR